MPVTCSTVIVPAPRLQQLWPLPRLAEDVLGLVVPTEAERSFGRDPATSSLSRDLRDRLFTRRGEHSRSWENAAGVFRVCERRRDRLRQAIRLMLLPTIADAKTLDLPPRLAWLYFLVRPVRLIWKHGIAPAARSRARLSSSSPPASSRV